MGIDTDTQRRWVLEDIGLTDETADAIQDEIQYRFAKLIPQPSAILLGTPPRYGSDRPAFLWGVPIKWVESQKPGEWYFEDAPREVVPDLPPKSVLDLAQERVETKPDDYGPPAENVERIARLWSIYLQEAADLPHELTGRDVGVLMVLLKVAREANQQKRDNLVDIAGWAAVADEASQ
jgi:Domain of unknown function (DUF6378)